MPCNASMRAYLSTRLEAHVMTDRRACGRAQGAVLSLCPCSRLLLDLIAKAIVCCN